VVLVYRLQDSTLSIDSTPTRKRDNDVSITLMHQPFFGF
jgi:hypothetical protein